MRELESNNKQKGTDNHSLFESDRKLRTLVRNLPGVVYRCHNDKKRTMEFISRGCSEISGFTQDQFYDPEGVLWGELIHEEDKERVWQEIQHALTNDHQFHLNYRIHCSDRNIRWVSEHGSGIKQKKDGPILLEGFIEDITVKKEGEKLLKTRNRALNAAGRGIIIADAKVQRFPITYANEAFEEITGYTEHEVMGRNCDFLQGTDKDQEEINIIRHALQKGESCKVILRNYRKDGTLFWNELTITPVRNEKDDLTHFIAILNDITLKKNQERIKESQRLVLENIIKNEPIEEISNQIVSILENHIKDSIGAIWKFERDKDKLEVLSAPNLPDNFKSSLNGIPLNPNSCSCGIAAHFKKDVIVENMLSEKSWQPYREYLLEHNLKACWSFPMLSSTSEILGVLCLYLKSEAIPEKRENELIMDASQLASLAIEQNNIRSALLEGKLRLEETIEKRTSELSATIKELEKLNESLDDQIVATNRALSRAETSEEISSAIAKNFPKGVIILINEQMEIVYMEGTALSHIRQQKILHGKIGIDDLKNFSKERKVIFKNYISRTLEGEHLSFEIKYRGLDYMVNTTPLHRKGNNSGITHALLVLNDISEHKRAEQDIRTALKKQQELNDLKSRFIATASHEFRTPLSIILSSATLIERQNKLGQESKRLRHTGLIRNNVQNLVTILNDFLSLGKLEEGEIKPIQEPFNLVGFTTSLIQQLETNLKKGQSIEFIESNPVVMVSLDPKLMRYIISNLMSNAIKYSHEGQTIVVDLKEKNDTVTLSVIDQGIGIPLEEQKNMFQRFFRAQNSLNIKGTGLGLTIVKQYTELMGGTIRFISKENQGSTFILEFPKP